jgi:hypothetical protein
MSRNYESKAWGRDRSQIRQLLVCSRSGIDGAKGWTRGAATGSHSIDPC